MSRWLVGLATVFGVGLGASVLLAGSTTEAQDRTQERLIALETRVAGQDARILALEEASRRGVPLPAPTVVPTPIQYVITGDYRLRQDMGGGGFRLGEPCNGYTVYRDIREGAPVVVKGGAGDIIGYGQLGPGVVVSADTETTTNDTHCLFSFAVDGLPRSDRYVIQVGIRTKETFTFGSLESAAWQVHMGLGG